MASLTLQQKSEEGAKEAYSYLHEVRGFSDEAIQSFKLGYVPRRVRNEHGSWHELAGRIVIPIFDAYGRLIAVSSRDWRDGARIKFWHEKYSKSLYMYGLQVTKPSIMKYRKVVVVEGEFDAISLYSHGLSCVVASIGTSLQLYQVSILKRYADDIYLAYDGDVAGKKATEKALQLGVKHSLSSFDVNLIPVYLPTDMDPDELVKEDGKSGFIRMLNKAKERSTHGKR